MISFDSSVTVFFSLSRQPSTSSLVLSLPRSGLSTLRGLSLSPNKVLDYLGRYTHRVAISNNRILSLDQGRVTFSYRDRRNSNRLRSMTLESDEFIRRFLLHVLPDGFMRIRHFGFLANRSKKQDLAQCRELLGIEPQPNRTPKKSARGVMLDVTGVDLALCPMCRVGTLIVIGPLPALQLAACYAQPSSAPAPTD